jgi:glutamine synthetase
MVGSAFSIAFPNTVLNTIVAESLSEMADALEKSKNFKEDLAALIKSTIIKHKRIIFNGNNYSPEWEVEAAKRGLLNLKNTVDALPSLVKEANVKMFVKHGVLSESEIHSRYEVQLENYCKTINIEALTMTDMVKKSIVPAIISYQGELASVAASKKAIGDFIPVDLEVKTLEGVSKLGASLYKKLEALDAAVIGANEHGEAHAKAKFIRDNVITAMSELREVVDELELRVAADYWPFPTYGEMLFYVD